MSLRAVLARPGMPSKSMVMRWLADEHCIFRPIMNTNSDST
ncbi:hypothetical protein [Aeromonas media]